MSDTKQTKFVPKEVAPQPQPKVEVIYFFFKKNKKFRT